MVHDKLVGQVWPGVEPVGPGELRDAGLLSSAVARPFQTAFGQEIHDSVVKKAAALFHSLISNHAFQNGNKRTAVLALGHFMIANGYVFALVPDEMYELAKDTATYKVRGLTENQIFGRIIGHVESFSSVFDKLPQDEEFDEIRFRTLAVCDWIRQHPLNREQPPQ